MPLSSAHLHHEKYWRYPGGNFRCILSFPSDFPLMPPTLTFKSPIPFHPNIYPSGLLCISILHPPEEDQYGYEKASERWLPVHTPETILVSVLSLLNDPNDESPANVEAARLWRDERNNGSKDFKKRCRRIVRESLGEDWSYVEGGERSGYWRPGNWIGSLESVEYHDGCIHGAKV